MLGCVGGWSTHLSVFFRCLLYMVSACWLRKSWNVHPKLRVLKIFNLRNERDKHPMLEEVKREAFCVVCFGSCRKENVCPVLIFSHFICSYYISSFAYSCRYMRKTSKHHTPSYTLIFTIKLWIVYTRNSLLLFLAGQKAGRDFIVLSCPPFAPWAMCHRRRRQCRCVCCSPLERWRSKRGCLPQPRSRRNEWYWVVVNVFVHIIFAHGVR